MTDNKNVAKSKIKKIEYPKIICSSVIRYAQKGESHGKIYIVDLNTDKFQEVIDWRDDSINWEGVGYDRGLRGIAIHNGMIYIASTDKILVYDKNFLLVEKIENKYLNYCHEIFIKDKILYITSTAFNSVLEYDLNTKSFIRGYYLKSGKILRFLFNIERILIWIENKYIPNLYFKYLIRNIFDFITQKPKNQKPKLIIFNPNFNNGPKFGDCYHINNVFKKKEKLFVSGTNTIYSYYINNNKLVCFSKGTLGNHNLRPYKNGVLLSDTNFNSITYKDRFGKIIDSFRIIEYKEEELINFRLLEKHIRPSFARGLCISKSGLIIGGSSPATISVYKFGNHYAIKTIRISRDVRNAIHGLEIWPY